MAQTTDEWVQRLREGRTPSWWPLLTGLGVMTLGSLAVLMVEFAHPSFLSGATTRPRGLYPVLVPLALVVIGPVIAISSWLSSRHDRRILRRIRASSSPALYLPVIAKGIRASEDLPKPRPLIWTVDRSGLRGWAPSTPLPAIEVAWSSIVDIDIANKLFRGQLTGYALSVTTRDATFILRCRGALGRSFEAGERNLGVLLHVLLDLRRELDLSRT